MRREDFREAVRRRRASTTVVFLVDSSGSMGARQQMTATKGAVISLLLDAYRRRDRIGLIACSSGRADVVLSPSSSVSLAHDRMTRLPTGGRTALASGLALALRLMRIERRTNPGTIPLLVFLSDGHANVPITAGGDAVKDVREMCRRLALENVRSLFLDTEIGPVRLGLMRQYALAANAAYTRMDDVRAERLACSVRRALERSERQK